MFNPKKLFCFKSIICLLLAMTILFLLAGCGNDQSENTNTVNESKSLSVFVEHDQDKEFWETVASKEGIIYCQENNINSMEIYNENGVIITIMGLAKMQGSPAVAFKVQNDTDLDIRLFYYYISIDGVAIEPIRGQNSDGGGSNVIAAHKTEGAALKISENYMNYVSNAPSNIWPKSVGTIEIGVSFESDDGTTPLTEIDIVSLQTNNKTENNTFNIGNSFLYEDDEVKITYDIEKTFDKEYNVFIWFENKSDRYLGFGFGDVNGVRYKHPRLNGIENNEISSIWPSGAHVGLMPGHKGALLLDVHESNILSTVTYGPYGDFSFLEFTVVQSEAGINSEVSKITPVLKLSNNL